MSRFVKLGGILINTDMVVCVRIEHTPQCLDPYALVFESTSGGSDALSCENMEEAECYMLEFQRKANL